jgi:hypothetical protein
LLAGRSNAGIADPAHATAISLSQVTTLFSKITSSLDNVVAAKILVRLADEIGDVALAAHKQLEHDDE